MTIKKNRLLIIDFGSQLTRVIARRVREIGVYSELVPYSVSEDFIREFSPDGIILSGGPDSVSTLNSPRAPDIVFQIGCPVLGICYGMQTMAAQLGGEVKPEKTCEFGYAEMVVEKSSALFDGLTDRVNEKGQSLLEVWMSHGDQVIALPKGFNKTGSSAITPITAMSDENRRFYGVQFHPEAMHTKQSRKLFERFVLELCQCQQTWQTKDIIDENISQIQEQVGRDQVILGLSGGVDSSVVAALLQKAIGDQLICIFVDTGLLRLHEVEQVQKMCEENIGVQLITVDAASQFYEVLQDITDPEIKRKIIGELFIAIFSKEAERYQSAKWLAQGTIYPDVIESAATEHTGISQLIKSHHNVGGLPKNLPFKLIEPLRSLFKDEVREIGLALGLSADMINRHPFPGPGLAVRIMCDVKAEYVEILRYADAVFIDALKKANLYDKVSQAFAVFLPTKTVAVKGDARHYEYVIALRAVKTEDFMTADYADLPHEFLKTVSNRILNEVRGVSRVVYDISGKPPSTIEWE